MFHLQVRGQQDLEVVHQKIFAGDHEVPQVEVEMMYMFQEQEHPHAVSLREEMSDQDHLLAVGLRHLVMLAPEVHSTRNVRVTSHQDLDDHHLLQNESDFLHQDGVVSTEEGLPEEPTHHLANPPLEAATDLDPALLPGAMIDPHIRTTLGNAPPHLVLLGQLLGALHDVLHLRFTHIGLV